MRREQNVWLATLIFKVVSRGRAQGAQAHVNRMLLRTANRMLLLTLRTNNEQVLDFFLEF